MIDNFDVEQLKEPKNVKVIIKNLETNIDGIDKKLSDTRGDIYNPEHGIKVALNNMKDDLKELEEKLENIVNAQKETRKTVKNTAFSAGIGTIITGVIAYVLKQLGIY